MHEQIMTAYEALSGEARERLHAGEVAQKIRIQVGSATCEHAAGSLDVLDEFVKIITASGRSDIVLRRTGCTGRCSREPIVGVLIPGQMPVKYEKVNRDLVHRIFVSHIQGNLPLMDHVLDNSLEKLLRYEFLFCGGRRCGLAAQGDAGEPLYEVMRRKLRDPELDIKDVAVTQASCFGACSMELAGKYVHVLVRPQKILYRIQNEADLDEIIREHVQADRVVERLVVEDKAVSQDFFDLYGDVAFFNAQSRIALRHNGIIDPESLDEYLAYDGFRALAGVLADGSPGAVVNKVKEARLRGRGGGGFPTGTKWELIRKNAETTRYLICNADEGDPGAFMDRSMLESDPFNIIEGMLLGAYAIEATQGFVYVRAEYPLAIKRIQHALNECRAHGLLGRNILDSGFDFDIEIRLGAGAFVCGEETALIRSIEGERGQPRLRPPYPTESGLWGKPTVINNVETFANLTAIINFGGDWFSRMGTETSGGTKVFALAGKVRHTGLVEVPLGTTLGRIVQEIGGGVAEDRALKAIQTGGPAGGFIPASAAGMEVDFDTLARSGSIMGSGGMIVLSEDDCMVDIAKYYLSFSRDESCGKCAPCREGTMRMFEILERITAGQGVLEDLDKLERLARLLKRASLCGLGRAAPNPVLSGLRHFREEYLTHVLEKRCPAKKCVALVQYTIDAEKCIGCTVCARRCPASCITGIRKQAHLIDQTRCIKCGGCYTACRFSAITRS